MQLLEPELISHMTGLQKSHKTGYDRATEESQIYM